MIYFTISNQVSRIGDGVCGRIPPSEILAWQTLTGIKLDSVEYSLFVDMDEAFSIEMTKELTERREKALKAPK